MNLLPPNSLIIPLVLRHICALFFLSFAYWCLINVSPFLRQALPHPIAADARWELSRKLPIQRRLFDTLLQMVDLD